MESVVETEIINMNDLKKVVLQKLNGKGIAEIVSKNRGEKDLVTKVLRKMLFNELDSKIKMNRDENPRPDQLVGFFDEFRLLAGSTRCVRVLASKSSSDCLEVQNWNFPKQEFLVYSCSRLKYTFKHK